MKIKKKESNEDEKDENEIDIKGNATSDGDDETTKDDHHFKNLCQS